MTKILVIEDEEDIRVNVLEVLEFEGFESIGAENGRIGVELAKKHIPDLIICDISMPELGGYDVLSELRDEPLTAIIPLIFLTAKSENKDVRKGMKLGADDYLTKPFEIDDLLSAIRVRLEKHAILSKQVFQKIEDLSLHLSYSLPHELRTPLTGIISFAQLLIEFGEEMAQTPEEIIQIGQSIFESALRLHRLTENYLLYAELKLIEHQPDKLQRQQRHTLVAIDEVVEPIARKKAREFQRQDDVVLNLDHTVFQFSESGMQKLVTEILDNAFKFSNKGTPVDISIRVINNQAVLSVTNHGRGMTKEQLTNIGAYRQFDRDQYEQQGSGLGLTIACLLAQLHGANITIDSVPNDKTTITCIFERPS